MMLVSPLLQEMTDALVSQLPQLHHPQQAVHLKLLKRHQLACQFVEHLRLTYPEITTHHQPETFAQAHAT